MANLIGALSLALLMALAAWPAGAQSTTVLPSEIFDPTPRPPDEDDTFCCLAGTCCPPPAPPLPQIWSNASVSESFERSAQQSMSFTAGPVETPMLASLTESCRVRVAPPYRVRRANRFYGDTNQFKQCAPVRKELLSARTVGGRYTVKIGEIAPDLPRMERYRELLMDHDEKCALSKSVEVSRSVLTPRTYEELLQSTGYLIYNEQGGPICTATIVADKLLTARHCVTANAPLKFATFGNPARRYAVNTQDLSGTAPETSVEEVLSSDWILLDFANQIDGPSSQLRFAPVKQWDELLVVGLDETKQQLRFLEHLMGVKALTPLSPVEIKPTGDYVPRCVAAIVDKGLIQHSCLTGNSSSGAPLFRVTNEGALLVVGVQVGHVGNLKSECMKRFGRFFPNIAANVFDLLTPEQRAVFADGSTQ